MSNCPANIKNNIETPEGYPQIIPSAPLLDNEPIEVYDQPIIIATIPYPAPRLTIEQFQPNYLHNSRLYAPKPKRNEFYHVQRNNNQPRQNNNNKGFFASITACLCCLFCCCPIGC